MNFLVELSTDGNEMICHFTPSNKYSLIGSNTIGIISEININKPDDTSYWVTVFGGYNDTFNDYTIELRFGSEFLVHVDTAADLLTTPNSMFMENRIVYVNIPKHTWLYPDNSARNRIVHPFLTAAMNPDNPSNNFIEDKQAGIRLEPPNFTVKLSDNYYGVILNQGFNISLINNDGFFDDENKWNLFNSPVVIKKSMKDISEYQDFKEIREGYIESTTTQFETFEVTAGDNLSTLNNQVCTVITQELFPDITIDEQQIGKSIPVIFGTVRSKLIYLQKTEIEINDHSKKTNCVYLLPEGTSNVGNVYDKNGNLMNKTVDIINKTITTTVTIDSDIEADKEKSPEAENAIITGYTDSKIGTVLKRLFSKTRFASNAFFNVTEWNTYNNTAPSVNIEFTSGDIKSAINKVLQNDMIYLIQQSDGKFTIRQYGKNYTTRNLYNWQLTKTPEKDYADAYEDYFSACIINYDEKSYLYNTLEYEAEKKYQKRVLKTFDTDLTNSTDALKFAALLSRRFTGIKQTIKIALGIDTSDFQLLDTIQFDDFSINGRKFTTATTFFIKEINYAQDTLTIEEI